MYFHGTKYFCWGDVHDVGLPQRAASLGSGWILPITLPLATLSGPGTKQTLGKHLTNSRRPRKLILRCMRPLEAASMASTEVWACTQAKATPEALWDLPICLGLSLRIGRMVPFPAPQQQQTLRPWPSPEVTCLVSWPGWLSRNAWWLQRALEGDGQQAQAWPWQVSVSPGSCVQGSCPALVPPAPPASWVLLRVINPVRRLGLGLSFSTVIR